MRNLVRWEPFKELATVSDIFERFLGRSLKPTFSLLQDGFWSPAVDVYDKKDRLVAKVELPGIDKKDVKINIDGDVLNIKGEVRKEQETKEKDCYYSERAYGNFSRSILLPVVVQKEKAKASYKDGILTIDLPKSEDVKSKEIEIEVK